MFYRISIQNSCFSTANCSINWIGKTEVFYLSFSAYLLWFISSFRLNLIHRQTANYSVLLKDVDSNQDITSTHLIDTLENRSVNLYETSNPELAIKLLPNETSRKCSLQVIENGSNVGITVGETAPFIVA